MTQADAVRHWPAVWALSIGFFLVSIDGTIVVVATPALMASLGASTDLALWVTSAYLLCSAAPLLLFGRLGDRFGRGRVYLVGLVGFIVASLLCSAAPSVGALIAARCLQGLAAAAMAPQSLAIIREITPPDRLGRAMGLWGSSSGLANVLGPLLGGLLAGWLGWRAVFAVNLPIGLIPLVLALRHAPVGAGGVACRWTLAAPRSPSSASRCSSSASSRARDTTGARSSDRSACRSSSASACSRCSPSSRSSEPVAIVPLPLAVFRAPGYAAGAVSIAMIAMIVTATPIPLALAVQNGLGMSPMQAALVQLPIGVGAAVLTPVVGRLIDRHGPRPIALVGTSAYVLTGVGIGLAIGSRSVTLMVLATSAFGVANAMVWASLSVLAMSRVPPLIAGPAAASYNAFRQFGAVLGAAGVAAVVQVGLVARFGEHPGELAAVLAGSVAPEAVAGYAAAMATASIAVSLVGVVAVAALVAVRRRP